MSLPLVSQFCNISRLGRVDVSRLDFVRSGKYVLAKRGMMCSYSTQMTSDKEQGLARRTLRAAFGWLFCRVIVRLCRITTLHGLCLA
ncbi:hypothetical protein DIKCMJMK_00195 [Shewanella oneidensis]|nr:hypothetical protein [Shewanella oneidensis]